MDRRVLLAAMLLAGSELWGASAASGPDAQVTIDNFSFTPATMTVARGTRVTWTNRDDIPHTVTDAASPGTVKSSALDTDDSYSRTFDTVGTFGYFCSLHPHMQGTVVVQ